MKKILITGGSGFVGQNIIHTLLQSSPDYKIYNLSNNPVGIEGVEDIVCDAADFNFSDLGNDFEYVIHLLALSNEKYCETFELADTINVNFSKKVLEFARTLPNLKKLIHLSSIIIYDNQNVPPVKEEGVLNLNYTAYSFTKGVSEHYVRFFQEKYGLPIVIFRLSNIYGPYQEFRNSPFLVPSKIMEALEQGKIEVFNLNPKRDWIYSMDAAEAIVQALDADINGIYNLATGEGVSVEDIVSVIAEEFNVPYTSLDKPTSGPINFFCDISKIQSDLGWSPKTPLKKGLKETIRYIKERL